jgi:hypothetical protein
MCRVERGAVPKRAELFAATCSNPSAKFEFLAFVGSNKKRTEMFSGAFGFSVSANDKFLLSMELILTHVPLRFPASYREPLRLPIRPSSRRKM